MESKEKDFLLFQQKKTVSLSCLDPTHRKIYQISIIKYKILKNYFRIGLHVYLNGPGGSGGLRVLNNQMGLNIEEPYYFQAVGKNKFYFSLIKQFFTDLFLGMFNDVCGGITKYKNSNSSCFPPGDNCCGVDCTRLCSMFTIFHKFLHNYLINLIN